MKRMLVLSIALALPLAAQQAQPPKATNSPARAAASSTSQKQVAIVNGEIITAERFEYLWNNMGVAMHEQYEKAGGKPAFLENYLRKRLVLQEAIKAGFDKRPDVKVDMDSAAESALFDRYVRDVVAEPIIPESEIRKYYDEHKEDFAVPEKVKVRHIVITAQQAGPLTKTKEQALERIKQVAADLLSHDIELRDADPTAGARLRLIYFSDAARKYSEDGSASSGGDLGWHAKGELDPTFEEAAFGLPLGRMSGVVETKFGYHLILVEDHRASGTDAYENVRPTIREFILAQKAADVMTAVNRLTNELRMTSKVTLFPENLKP